MPEKYEFTEEDIFEIEALLGVAILTDWQRELFRNMLNYPDKLALELKAARTR